MSTEKLITPEGLFTSLKMASENIKKKPGGMKSTVGYLELLSKYVERIVTAKDRGKFNDKCAGGTGRFMEIVAEALHIPLSDIGPLSLQFSKVLPFSTTCAAFGRGAAVALMKEGERKEDILAGLHEAIAKRVVSLVKKVGIADKFVITGGIGRNVGLVSRIEERLDGLKVTLPQEPMIVGALGAALFALDRARKGLD